LVHLELADRRRRFGVLLHVQEFDRGVERFARRRVDRRGGLLLLLVGGGSRLLGERRARDGHTQRRDADQQRQPESLRSEVFHRSFSSWNRMIVCTPTRSTATPPSTRGL